MRTFSTFLFVLICFSQQFLQADHPFHPNLALQMKMRDGKELPTHLYFPENQDPKDCPCLLVRSPAGLFHPFLVPYLEMRKAGYVVCFQATRNALDEEGKTLPFYADGSGNLQDGYDTIEFLGESPYCNGKIGTAGASALGITQHLLAPTAPPHLVCQHISIAAPSLYQYAIFPHGQMLKSRAEGWLGLYARDPGILSYVMGQHFYNPFWQEFNSLEKVSEIKTPAVHFGGWYDIFLEGTLDAFLARHLQGGDGAKNTQKLVIGPWTHFFYTSDQLGDFTIPLAGKLPPLDFSMLRWFNYYLKGDQNGIKEDPAILYYVMGPFDEDPSSGNVWRTSDEWPIPALPVSFYLHEKGSLLPERPKEKGLITFTYDPENPVPTIGGNNLFLEAGPKDQRLIEQREDVLVFTSNALEEDLEVTGNLKAKIYFSTDQKDTDLVLRLCDVYPDGRSILLSDACYRLDVMHYPYEEKSQKGKIPLCCEVNLSPTSIVFAKGHQIRISLTSSNYPRYEKNRNIGLVGSFKKEPKIAKNTLYLGKGSPSEITLPVVRQGDHWFVKNLSEKTVSHIARS